MFEQINLVKVLQMENDFLKNENKKLKEKM